jgi:hypothetical protein
MKKGRGAALAAHPSTRPAGLFTLWTAYSLSHAHNFVSVLLLVLVLRYLNFVWIIAERVYFGQIRVAQKNLFENYLNSNISVMVHVLGPRCQFTRYSVANMGATLYMVPFLHSPLFISP